MVNKPFNTRSGRKMAERENEHCNSDLENDIPKHVVGDAVPKIRCKGGGVGSLIRVGYYSLGQLLALKRIELESPATSQIEDDPKAFPTVI